MSDNDRERRRFDDAVNARYDAPGRTRKDQIGDWLTWGARGITVLIGYGVWQLLLAMNGIQISMAKMSMSIDQHTQEFVQTQAQIQQLWQEIRRDK